MIRASAAIGIVLTYFLLVQQGTSAMEAGFQIESFRDNNRERPISIDWWYPVVDQSPQPYNYGFGSGKVVESGQIAPGRFPLITLSHGAMGAARNYSWIAESLARSGYIVAGVSHYGESYIYGADTVDPAAVLRAWERAVDISSAITHISNHSAISESIDLKRIGFIGHSSGGATGLQLAGARFDGQKMAEYCSSSSAAGDKGCDYAADIPLVDTPVAAGDNYADERIQAFVVLDPALGPGFSNFSGVSKSTRLLIVGSVDNDFLPFQHHAQRIADQLPDARTNWLANGEGHFVYLNACTADIEANGVPLWVDREGVSRESVHRSLIPLIDRHFQSSFN